MHPLRKYALASAALAIAATSGCASGSRSAAAVPQSAVESGSPTTGAAPTTAAAPSSTASATLDYIAPAGHTAPEVHKTVTGATYQRLFADLAALKPVPQGNVTCNVVNGESGTVTLQAGGHTRVWVVDGSPCRGVTLTTDGGQAQLLGGNVILLNQVRAIAGTSGLAHPLSAN